MFLKFHHESASEVKQDVAGIRNEHLLKADKLHHAAAAELRLRARKLRSLPATVRNKVLLSSPLITAVKYNIPSFARVTDFQDTI